MNKLIKNFKSKSIVWDLWYALFVYLHNNLYLGLLDLKTFQLTADKCLSKQTIFFIHFYGSKIIWKFKNNFWSRTYCEFRKLAIKSNEVSPVVPCYDVKPNFATPFNMPQASRIIMWSGVWVNFRDLEIKKM